MPHDYDLAPSPSHERCVDARRSCFECIGDLFVCHSGFSHFAGPLDIPSRSFVFKRMLLPG